MFSQTDTIVAIATPAGRGGIGVVRLSGPAAAAIGSTMTGRAETLEPRRATLARVIAAGTAIDRAVLTFFPAPHSYTGEDVLEISAHGSPVLLNALVSACMEAGARLAEPGEFTLRAYLLGRIDLVQAEAVRDLVDAVTPLQARAAFDQLEGTLTTRIEEAGARLFEISARLEASLDFAGEGYHFIDQASAAGELEAVASALGELVADAGRGRLIRSGAQIAVTGRTNTGKSSIFNKLTGSSRSIVTAIPGTTRDLVTEVIDLDGLAATMVDTAGVRADAADAVEEEGMARARSARQVADLTVVVLDRSRALSRDDEELLRDVPAGPRVVAGNKSDLPPAWDSRLVDGLIEVSALTGAGIDDLRVAMREALLGREPLRDIPAVTNLRHADLLSRAHDAVRRAAAAARAGTPEEFVAADVREARARLEEVTGKRTPEDVLRAIFERFCIGK